MLLLSIAAANTLDFERLAFETGAKGVVLSYAVAAEDWALVEAERERGVDVSVRVTLQVEGERWTAVMPLRSAARTVTLSLREWPAETSYTLGLRDRGPFVGVGHAGQAGGGLAVGARGGVAVIAPLLEPTRELVAPPPPAEAVAPAPSAVSPTALAPAVPVGTCEWFQRARHRRSCEAWVEAGTPRIDDAVALCTAELGVFGDGLACVRAAATHPDDPVPDLRACLEGLDDYGTRIGCVTEAGKVDWPVADTLAACRLALPSDPWVCMSRVFKNPREPAALVSACTAQFQEDQRHRCLAWMGNHPGERLDVAVENCGKAFDKRGHQLECVALLRRHPDPALISSQCAVMPRGRMRCMEEGPRR